MADPNQGGKQQTQTERSEESKSRAMLRSEARRTQTYRSFIRQLSEASNMSEELAERATISVMCALEQRILSDEAADMDAQLPAKLREMLWRCERHEGRPPLKLDLDGFLNMVSEDLGLKSREEAESVTRNVFTAVRVQISEGEAEDVMAELPKDLSELWMRPI